MEITIGKILTFLVILFSINVVLTGLGLADVSYATKNTVIQSTPSDLYSNIRDNDLNVSEGHSIEGGSDATTDPDLINGIPYKTGAVGRTEEMLHLLKGLTIGYGYIFVSLGLPMLIVWLLTGIIAFIQFLAIFYLISYVFSILRGGGGI